MMRTSCSDLGCVTSSTTTATSAFSSAACVRSDA
jgi:hypothetical protein